MFGHEYFHYLNFIFQEKIYQMLLLGIGKDAGLVAYYPYFFSLEEGQVDLGLLGTNSDFLRISCYAAGQYQANGQNVA
jgi:hypothetical protein